MSPTSGEVYQLSTAAIDALVAQKTPVVFPAHFACGHRAILSREELEQYPEGQAGLAVITMMEPCCCIEIKHSLCPTCATVTAGVG